MAIERLRDPPLHRFRREITAKRRRGHGPAQGGWRIDPSRRPPVVANRATNPGMRRARSPKRLEQLTPREREIHAKLATGASASEMAGELGIAVPTIKRHLANIYLKLGCSNRVQASNLYHLGDPAGRPSAASRS